MSPAGSDPDRGARGPDGVRRSSATLRGVSVRPIFVFTISRSGSTLLQRVLATHEDVATVSEPWILLPLVYSLHERGIIADYVHPTMVSAIADFIERFPDGPAGYDREIRDFVMRLYEKATGDSAKYFVDKSPYHHIVSDIIRIFPDSKFLFLWRNPLGVAASMIETWEQGRWYPTMYRGDLFSGVPNLVAGYTRHRDIAHAVNFESLVSGEERPWREVMDYLELDFDPRSLSEFANVKLGGRMGDPTGVKAYSALSREPLDKWKQTFANPLRIAWARRYLRFLGAERLEAMGYSLTALEAELDAQPRGTSGLASDLVLGGLDVLKEPARVRVRNLGLDGVNVIRELLAAA